MNFLGSIEAVIGRCYWELLSGLDKLLELIYTSNSVTHIMSSKAVAGLLRGHFLVESALMGLIEQAAKDEFDTSSLEKMYEDMVQGNLDFNDVESSNIVIRFTNAVEKFKSELSSASRTAKLWLQYLEYISIIRMFIRAERNGNWHQHLEAMRLMLNVFAATGQINYA